MRVPTAAAAAAAALRSCSCTFSLQPKPRHCDSCSCSDFELELEAAATVEPGLWWAAVHFFLTHSTTTWPHVPPQPILQLIKLITFYQQRGRLVCWFSLKIGRISQPGFLRERTYVSWTNQIAMTQIFPGKWLEFEFWQFMYLSTSSRPQLSLQAAAATRQNLQKIGKLFLLDTAGVRLFYPPENALDSRRRKDGSFGRGFSPARTIVLWPHCRQPNILYKKDKKQTDKRQNTKNVEETLFLLELYSGPTESLQKPFFRVLHTVA